MKKNKANVICSVICILITVALVGVAVCGIVKHNKEKSREQAMKEYEQVQQQSGTHNQGSADNSEIDDIPNITTDGKTPENTVPSIKEDPELPDVQGQPSIDVGEMTKNPEAEVVGSEIEYGTKEVESHAK